MESRHKSLDDVTRRQSSGMVAAAEAPSATFLTDARERAGTDIFEAAVAAMEATTFQSARDGVVESTITMSPTSNLHRGGGDGLMIGCTMFSVL